VSLTPFQVRARAAFEAVASSRAHELLWVEHPGNLYAGEVMLVGSAADPAFTVWLYDDSIDYKLSATEVFNFESANFPRRRISAQ
jgi:hypothetical protein